ncbi:MAG: hypothetical protein Q8O92_01075 [Candidatus Latescibacter sp.]|nr:hypothetical protein [Candidatus Latescibacter sp.]
MKKLTLVFSFMLSVTLCTLFHSNAYSQPPAGGQGQRAPISIDQQIDQLDKAVSLTPDQKKKIRAIYEENEKNRTQPPAQSSGDRPNARRDRLNQSQQMGGRGQALNQEIEKVLTPAQVKKLAAFRNQSGIDRRIEQLSSLKLTDDQKKKLRTVFENQNARMQKTREQRQSQGQDQSQDQQAMMETFRKMQEENNNEIKKVLTAAQAKQYDDMQQQMMNRRGQGGGQGRGGRGQQN